MRARQRDNTAAFAEYGFTLDDYTMWHAHVMGGGPAPDSETQAGIDLFIRDSEAARKAAEAAAAERHRRFWFAVGALVGLAGLVATTIFFTTLFSLHLSARGSANLGMLGLIGILLAIFMLGYHSRR